jgi:hypothetical protein
MSEWAQLKRGPPSPDSRLERGHWYPIGVHTHSGRVRVIAPDGVGIPLSDRSVRIVDHDPNHITRVQATDFQPVAAGDSGPELEYYGVCPMDHEIGTIRAADSHAECSECGRSFPIEDEEHF